MRGHAAHLAAAIPVREKQERATAAAYNQAGAKYLAYADGNPKRLYAFDGQYAYGDSRVWDILEAKLAARRHTGARAIRILDLGCGPGTWLRRIVTRACELGFDSIIARGFDIADGQVRRARELSRDLAKRPGVSLTFETGDIFAPLAEADASVDLCLCLCAVLNHLPAAALRPVFAEIARVTVGHFIASVRASGSTPTVYVDAIEHARQFRQNNRIDRLDVEFQNGKHVTLPSHLFGAAELRALTASSLDVEDLLGLDLFHGRFAGDPRWNAQAGIDVRLAGTLQRLEAIYCRDPAFVDHAAHLLLVAKPRAASANGSGGRHA